MSEFNLIAVLFLAGIFSGVFIVYQGLQQRTRLLEMRHRERMAMIERGLIPLAEGPAMPGPRTAQGRSVSLGIVMVGCGLALAMVIGVAGESPSIGVGVGGAFAVLGGAFIVRGLVVANDQSQPSSHGSAGDPAERL